jgi:ribosomal protein S21
MSVIVHKNEPIENAFKRLQREAIRENVFNVVMKKRYRVKKSEEMIQKRRERKKMKRRRSAAKRKVRSKSV